MAVFVSITATIYIRNKTTVTLAVAYDGSYRSRSAQLFQQLLPTNSI